MKKRLSKILGVGLTIALIVALIVPVSAALAAKGDNPANDKAGKLYLYEKDADWNIVWDGAWGKMNYKLESTTIDAVFNGHGLVPGTGYTLVKYNGWPDVTVIGNSVADTEGNVHIQGTDVDIGPSGEEGEEGYKIWLILSSDVTGMKMTGWHQSSYLFEHNLIPY